MSPSCEHVDVFLPRNLPSQPLFSLGQLLFIIESRAVGFLAILLHLQLWVSPQVWVRVDLDGQQGQELGEESLVHLLVHLIQHKPVSDAAVEDIMLDVLGMTVAAQEAVHLDLHQEVANSGGGNLELDEVKIYHLH